MKRISMCVAAIAVFFVFSAPASSAPAPARRPEQNCGMQKDGRNPFKIAGFKDYPPFSWAELDKRFYKNSGFKTYTYNGFILDPLKQSLSEIGIVYTEDVVFDKFNETLRAMLHGKADLLFTGYYVDEGKSGLDYIYPAYFGNPFIVLSRKSKKIDVKDISELKGLKGVIRREEEVESLIRGLLPTDTKLEVVDGPETAFRMLLSGNADFMITSPYAADAEAKRFKIKDKLHFGNKVLRHIKYFLAFSKMSVCRKYKDNVAQKFNERFKNKEEIEKLIHKYIDIWVEQHADEPPLEYTPAVDEQPAPAAADRPQG